MKFRPYVCWALPLFFSAALLDAQLSTPRIGTVRYADGSVWTVNGLKANFVLGHRLFTGVTTAAFSDSGGLIAKAGEIDFVNADGTIIGRYQTQETHPVLDMQGDCSSATVWLPATSIVLHWNGKTFTETEAEPPAPTLFHQNSFTLFSDAGGLEIQSLDGSLQTLPIFAKDVHMEHMGSDWLHLSSASQHREWALFLTKKEIHLSELPAAPQETSK